MAACASSQFCGPVLFGLRKLFSRVAQGICCGGWLELSSLEKVVVPSSEKKICQYWCLPSLYEIIWICQKESGSQVTSQSVQDFCLSLLIFDISGDNPDDDQLLKTPGDGASTNLFLYNVSLFKPFPNCPAPFKTGR